MKKIYGLFIALAAVGFLVAGQMRDERRVVHPPRETTQWIHKLPTSWPPTPTPLNPYP